MAKKYEPKFEQLPKIGLSGEILPFSLWTPAYEQILDKKKKIKLREIHNDEPVEKIERYESLIPHFATRWSSRIESIQKILEKYPSVKSPCAMRIKNTNDLEKHLQIVYQMSYAHYVLGKSKNMHHGGRRFPDFCCGISADNLFLSLLERGYINALRFSNDEYDHGYVGLPFVMKNFKGLIIADPTSDQMWEKIKNPPRNNIFVASEKKWEYRTDWANNANLFPDEAAHLGTLNKFVSIGRRVDIDKEGDFFRDVFKKVVNVKI
ncbi:hypothetical protein J4474_03720 [Candidatus Pacearchaeota archaeon]|nr:hypothetical protein [Candidatus Pacearchaeota archaeon]